MLVEMMYKDSKGKNQTDPAYVDENSIARIIPSQDGPDSVLVFFDGEIMSVTGDVGTVEKVMKKARDGGSRAEELLSEVWELLGEYMAGDEELDDECEE